MEVPQENRKENTKSIKVKEKVILVGDSIDSGAKGKHLSTDKSTTIVCDIPCATSDDMVHHTNIFAKKKPKKLIVHAGSNDIYSNIDTIGNYVKIHYYVKTNANETKLIFSQTCCRGDRKGLMNEVKP